MINFLIFIVGVVFGGMFGALLYIASVLNRESEKWVEEDLQLRKYLKDNE